MFGSHNTERRTLNEHKSDSYVFKVILHTPTLGISLEIFCSKKLLMLPIDNLFLIITITLAHQQLYMIKVTISPLKIIFHIFFIGLKSLHLCKMCSRLSNWFKFSLHLVFYNSTNSGEQVRNGDSKAECLT